MRRSTVFINQYEYYTMEQVDSTHKECNSSGSNVTGNCIVLDTVSRKKCYQQVCRYRAEILDTFRIK